MCYLCYGDKNITCYLKTMCMEEKRVSGYPELYDSINYECHILNKDRFKKKKKKLPTLLFFVYTICTWCKNVVHLAFFCILQNALCQISPSFTTYKSKCPLVFFILDTLGLAHTA